MDAEGLKDLVSELIKKSQVEHSEDLRGLNLSIIKEVKTQVPDEDLLGRLLTSCGVPDQGRLVISRLGWLIGQQIHHYLISRTPVIWSGTI